MDRIECKRNGWAGEGRRLAVWAAALVATLSLTLGVVSLSIAAEKEFRFGVSKPGGNWYPIGAAVTELGKKQYGYKVTLPIGGGAGNVINVANGKMEFGITYATTAVDAALGRVPFKQKLTNVRLAVPLFPNAALWTVWADSGIKTYKDLKGKRVNALPKSFAAQVLNSQMLEAFGMSYKDFSKTVHLGYSDSVTQMKDGHIDANLIFGSPRFPAIVELMSKKPVHVLTFTDEDIQKIRKVQPALVPTTVKGSDFRQPGDIKTIHTFQVVVTSEKVSPELVYHLAKIILGNHDHMVKVNKNFADIDKKDISSDMGIARHPGFERYLKENNMM